MLVLVLLAGLVVSTVSAGQEPNERLIPVWLEGEYDIHTSQVGVPVSGWAACSPSLVRAYMGAAHWEMWLYDTETEEEVLHLSPQDVDALWAEITTYQEPPWFADLCVGKGRPAHAACFYQLSDLGPSSYRLRTLHWLDHTVVDGADSDGDGMIDLYTPYYRETVNVLNVE
jgi:hypothetical protein